MAKGAKARLWLGLALLGLGAWWLLHRPSPDAITRPDQPALTPVAAQPTPGPEPTTAPTPIPESGPRLAIVIDDWGYQSKPLAELPKMGFPLTTAVLPGLPFSERAAEAAAAAGDEVILHCPMQAHGHLPEEAGTLKATMSPAAVRALLAKEWDSLPALTGLNNHEGSLATEDAALMAVVADFLKERHGYFLDSLTTAKSVIPAAAKAAGIPWAARRVFLDNLDQQGSIRVELLKAATLAKKNGGCIAIGHPRANTLAVLQREAPALRAQGIRLVHVSELLKR